MQDSKNEKLFALIGAICFTVYAAFSVINGFYRAANSDYYTITWQQVVWWVIFIILAVMLFARKKNIVFLVPPVLATIMEVYYIIQYFSFNTLMYIVVYALLFVLLMLNVIPSMKKNAGATKVLCFIQAGLFLALTLFSWIRWRYFSYISREWMYMLFDIVEFAGYLFLGLWLKATMPVPEITVQQNPYATFNPQATAPQAQQTIGGADKLKMYKDLLDSGAITQEEFDAKKKQILGL